MTFEEEVAEFQSLFRDNERSSAAITHRRQHRDFGFNPSFGITNVQAA